MIIHSNEPLGQRTTLAFAANCRALATVEDEKELREALAWARANQTAVTVLGEGSNVVLAGDLDSLVLVQANAGIEVLEDDAKQVLLRVAAGENWHALVQWTLSQGFYGLENLALIPGTVGAAPIQNIGAYGVELESSLESVHALAIADSSVHDLTAADCEFSYRDSIFKHELRDQLVITAVDLRLSRAEKLQLGYPALAKALEGRELSTLTPRDIFDTVVQIRTKRLPDPRVLPNAGSFFKNPVLEFERASSLITQFPELPAYPQADGKVKFPAAWFIDYCGWKGHRDNGVGVHPEHALVLVNYGSDSGVELLLLANRIADSVEQIFGIRLEIEPRVYGNASE